MYLQPFCNTPYVTHAFCFLWWWWFLSQKASLLFNKRNTSFKFHLSETSVRSSLQSVALLSMLRRKTASPAPSNMSTQRGMCIGFEAPWISQTAHTPKQRWTTGVFGLSIVPWRRIAQMSPATVPWWAPSLADTSWVLWFRIWRPTQAPWGTGLHH